MSFLTSLIQRPLLLTFSMRIYEYPDVHQQALMRRNVYCGMQLKNDMLKRVILFVFASFLIPFPFSRLPFPLSLFRFFPIQTETNLAIQVKEAAEKVMEEYRREHPRHR